MDYGIIGGDARLAYLAALLSERGGKVGVCGQDGLPGLEAEPEEVLRADNLVVNSPPRLSRGEISFGTILELARPDARVFACGPGHPEPGDDRVVDLWSDEELIEKNARLTAEGAVSAAMNASGLALGDMRCLVVGWGRIGRALTELLVGLTARVTVASRRETGRNKAVERGAEAVDLANLDSALPEHSLIFNTAPAMVLEEGLLGCVDRDAMLVDLASPPYGIDLRAAWKRGLRAWREPSLPGRYCPRSAAKALLEAMERIGI